MKRLPYVALSLLIIALDLVTKQAILRNFFLHESREVIPGFFQLVYVQNRGAAFGLGASSGSDLVPMLLAIGAIVVFLLVAVYAFRASAEDRLLQVGLHLILGGAVGNLIDRYRFGWVVDFLDFYVTIGGREYHWPAFNVADSAICIGIGLLFLDMWKNPQEQKERRAGSLATDR